MICDICEYEHETAVTECPDGIIRCRVCESKLVHGRYIRDEEFENMTQSERERLQRIENKFWQHYLLLNGDLD